MITRLWRSALWMLLLVAGVLYSVTEGGHPGVEGIPVRVGELFSSPGFIAFVLLPAWFTYGLIDARSSHTLVRLVRLGSYRRLLVNVGVSSARTLVIPGLIVALAACAAGAVPGATFPRGRALALIEAAGFPLVPAIVLQIGALALFLIVWRVLIECLVLVGPRWSAVGMSALVWVWAAGSASGLAPAPGPGDFVSYVVVAQSLTDTRAGLVVCLSYGALIAAFALVTMALDGASRRRSRMLSPSVWAFVVSLTAVALATRVTFVAGMDLEESLVTVFYGPTGNLLTALIGVTVVVGYAYFRSLRMSEELDGWALLTLIRYGSRPRHVAVLALREVRAAFVYSLATLAAAVGSYFLSGGRSTPTPTDAGILAFLLVVVQSLQIVFYVACVLLSLLLARDPRAGLAAVGDFAALAAVPLPPSWIVPIQRSGAAVLFDGGAPVILLNAAVLALCTCIAFVVAAHTDGVRRIAAIGLRLEEGRPA